MKISRKISVNIVTGVAVVIIAANLIKFGCSIRDSIPVHTVQKLVDCTNSELAVRFAMPVTESISLVLGFHNPTNKPFVFEAKPAQEFRGTMELRQGTSNIVTVPIDYGSVQSCTWLSYKGISEAYILDWSRSRSWWATNRLRAGETYELRFNFLESAPSNASIWVSLSRPYKDAKKQISILSH